MAGKGPAVYQAGTHPRKHKRRRRVMWLTFLAIILIAGAVVFNLLQRELQPKSTIKQARARTSKAVYDTKIKQYKEADFTLDLPDSWQPVTRPAGTPYQSYSWQSSDRVTNGQQITIYEDTIPMNFAVNKVLIVSGQQDHLQVEGSVSDNCSTFTKGLTPTAGQVGVPAKWQNVSFICDQFNQQRDVVGTSSADGVNTVLLKNQSTGRIHKFFFTYTVNDASPDYSVFYDALNSVRMQ